MANHATISLRLISKEGQILNSDAANICRFIISEVSELENELVFWNDKKNNILDIRFTCRRGFFEHENEIINSEKYYIWQITSWDEDILSFSDRNKPHQEKAEYKFDTISIVGNHSKLDKVKLDLLKNSQENWKNFEREILSSNEIKYKIQGRYFASNCYSIGNIYSLEPKEVKLDFFLKLREGYIDSIKKIEKLSRNWIDLLIEFMHDYEEIDNNFEGFRFYYKNRIVKELVKGENFYITSSGLKVKKRNWIMKSSDYWDNLVNERYTSFKYK